MKTFTIDRVSVNKLLATFNQIGVSIKTGSETATKAAAEFIVDKTKQNISETFSNRSGALADSVGYDLFFNDPEVEAVIYVDQPYAHIQEVGGTVWPVNAQVLVFEVNGEKVFTDEVTLPARPYLRPATIGQRPAIKAVIAEAISKELRHF